MKIPLSRPDISKKDVKEVARVLNTPYLSLGPRQEEFQRDFASYIGARYAEAVSNGTCALHLLMRAFGIGKGDEVITSPYSFIASSNCILFIDATPVFSDIDSITFNIDPDDIEEKITHRTKAILVVHIFGMPADMARINKIAKKHGLIVIEDACEAIGAEIAGKKVGRFSDAAAFGFYPNKQLTTGEGGMIVTDKKHVRDICRSMKNQGRGPKGGHFEFVRLGYNYRISDINCALGISQLRRIDKILARRNQIAKIYNEELSRVDGLEIPSEIDGFKRSWFVYVVKLSSSFNAKDRDRIRASLERKGIECGRYFQAIHLQPFYKKIIKYIFTICENILPKKTYDIFLTLSFIIYKFLIRYLYLCNWIIYLLRSDKEG